MSKTLAHLLVAVIVSSVNLQASQTSAQDTAIDYVNLVEKNVAEIKNSLVQIFTATCGQDPSCKYGCSQDMCKPLPNNRVLIISYANATSGLYNCTNQLQLSLIKETCAAIQLTYNTSSVTYVRSGSDKGPSGVQSRTICRTQQLDETFKTIFSRTYYTDYYAGMIDGTRRSFPGREEEQSSCLQYDSRKRPWYSGAISYPNHLVILVDCGKTMSEDAGIHPGISLLEIAQNYARSLLDTVYKDNYINVITFGADQHDIYNTSVQVDLDKFNTTYHKELENLTAKIDALNSTVAAKNTDVSSFLKGLRTTLEAFKDTNLNIQPDKMLHNVIILTDGLFAGAAEDWVGTGIIDEINSNNVLLFIFSSTDSPGLRNLTNLVNGVYTNLQITDDPLQEMISYFGYLAVSHRSLYDDEPFWSPNYSDFYGAGEIVTVSTAAFVNDTVIGVAAIDVFFNELPADTFLSDFQNVVRDRRQSQDSKRNAAESSKITSSVPAVFNDSSCSVPTSDAVCKSEDKPFDREKFFNRKCRNLCKDDGDKKLTIILGSVGGAVAVAVCTCLITAFFLWRRQRSKEREERKTPPDPQVDEKSWTFPL